MELQNKKCFLWKYGVGQYSVLTMSMQYTYLHRTLIVELNFQAYIFEEKFTYTL